MQMKKRESRMIAIKSIISNREVGSQEELLQLLEAEDYTLTQATLSRDLKQLKVAKAANSLGKYVYTLPDEKILRVENTRRVSNPILGSSFVSLQFSGNIAVVRTLPGYASGMAYHIDNQDNDDILGTIAGDDTIMLVIREGVEHQTVSDYLSSILSAIQ